MNVTGNGDLIEFIITPTAPGYTAPGWPNIYTEHVYQDPWWECYREDFVRYLAVLK